MATPSTDDVAVLPFTPFQAQAFRALRDLHARQLGDLVRAAGEEDPRFDARDGDWSAHLDEGVWRRGA